MSPKNKKLHKIYHGGKISCAAHWHKAQGSSYRHIALIREVQKVGTLRTQHENARKARRHEVQNSQHFCDVAVERSLFDGSLVEEMSKRRPTGIIHAAHD